MRTLLIFVCAVLLAGCAAKTYVPLAGVQQGNFEQSKAECSMVARHGGTGFYAQGNPNFVAGASLGHAIGDAVRSNQDFGDCMTMHGWTVEAAK